MWVQPAAGDAGGAIGAALAVCHRELGMERTLYSPDAMKGSYLGPKYEENDISERLKALGANFNTYSENKMIRKTAEGLDNGYAIGWFQGRMEFGPRSLGSRSIIADARSSEMQKTLNLKVKYRESFRPFAPSVLSEDVNEYFDFDGKSPYMLMVAKINKKLQLDMSKDDNALFGIDKLNVQRSSIPAVTHVDYSARIQTVHKETNKVYHALISKFKEITGCSVIVNTSFNVRGEPIVCTPEDAYRCFMGTELDMLVCGNTVLYKKDQDMSIAEDYKSKYGLD